MKINDQTIQTMKRRSIGSRLLLVALLGTVACYARAIERSESVVRTDAEATFQVIVSVARQPHRIVKASVYLIKDNQLVLSATTDKYGSARLSKTEIRESRSPLIVVCKDGFHCGAIRLDELKIDLADQEHMELAKYFIR